MTTGDEEAEGLVDGLFRDVDEQFDDLEREYSEAREDLAQTSPVVPSVEVPSIEVPSVEVPQASPEQFGAVTPAAPSTGEVLSIEVEDQFADLEREYSEAREELAVATPARIESPSEALEASHERFEMLSQVATLQAEVSRQANELDERDRMLSELGDKITGFEAEAAQRESLSDELHTARQETLDERREQARLAALLDARAAERQELGDVATRLQHDRDHVQDLLNTALARYDEAESRLAQMDDKVRHIEAERDTRVHEHDARAHELIESRAEMSKLSDRLDSIAKSATEADERAEKADALAERRANESGYLNRRIAAMTEKLEASDAFEADADNLRRELTVVERRVTELERELATEQSESAAARVAVEAIAERTSDYDELADVNEQLRDERDRLRDERDEAWKAASGPAPRMAGAAAPDAEPPAEPEAEVSTLAERAHELSARRSNEAAIAAEVAAAEAAANRIAAEASSVPEIATPEPVAPEPVAPETSDELEDLDADDVSVIDSDLVGLTTGEPEPATAAPDPSPAAHDHVIVPRVAELSELSQLPPPSVVPAAPEPSQEPAPAVAVTDTAEIPVIAVPAAEVPAVDMALVEAAKAMSGDASHAIPLVEAPSLTPAFSEQRKRIVLPAHLEPNTPEAVAHLLNQPGVTAIVDARSTCGRTGIRPSELFERVAALRDYFDVPVEVVVTPVSTPVGGAPDLPAIGVHHITGADTVADRIRALCMGFPTDQPLVVIAGDDHVRRAAIGEEANVIEPAAVLNLPTR